MLYYTPKPKARLKLITTCESAAHQSKYRHLPETYSHIIISTYANESV